MSRFLVLGTTGMAGHVIALYLKEQGHEVTGFSRRPVSFVESIVGDATNEGMLERAIEEGNYNIVVNAVGVLNKDADVDKERAIRLNSLLPHHLARITKKLSTKIIHMSTDCVFKGNTGPYFESSVPDGETFYDRTKALGELNDTKNLTFRNSIIGPDPNENGIGLFNWFMKQKGIINGFTGAMWTGLTTLELAKAIECAAVERPAGLINMVPEGNISKYDLLSLFKKNVGKHDVEIIQSDKLNLDKTLVRTNLEFSFKASSYEKQISEMAEWINLHSDLYPHYNLKD